MPLVAPIAITTGIVTLLALARRRYRGVEPPKRSPPPEPPDVGPAPVPPAPPPDKRAFGDLQTAWVMAESGLSLRSEPSAVGGAATRLALLPRLTLLGILDKDPLPSADGDGSNGFGWWHVLTAGGLEGYVSAQYVFFGSEKEARMTDEEFRRYNESRQNRPRREEQPVEITGWPYSASAHQRFRYRR